MTLSICRSIGARQLFRPAASAILLIAVLATAGSHAASAKNLNRPHYRRQPATTSTGTPLDTPAGQLISEMLDAQENVPVNGIQVSEIYRANAVAGQSTQRIYRAGLRGTRMEYLSPPQWAGEVQVDNGQTLYQYLPKRKKLNQRPSVIARMGKERSNVLAGIRAGRILVQVVGSEPVAGHNATIVQASSAAAPQAGSRKFWIDPSNGVQLKIASIDSTGSVVSQSYFTSITYNASIPAGTFDPPVTSPSVQTQIEKTPPPQKVVPPAASAGFAVELPSYVPSGYRYLNSQSFSFKGRAAVGLRYTDGVYSLSIYETPLTSTHKNNIESHKAGVASGAWNGLHVVAVGSINAQELIKILQSLH